MSALGASPLAQRLETSMIALLEQGGRFRKPVLLVDTVPTPLMRRRALPRDLLSVNRRMTESRENRTAFTHGKELTRASRFIEGNMNDLRRWRPRPWVLSR
jgi:hypothetical protein